MPDGKTLSSLRHLSNPVMHSFKWGKWGAYEIASTLPPETDWVRVSLKNECLNKSWNEVLACDVC